MQHSATDDDPNIEVNTVNTYGAISCSERTLYLLGGQRLLQLSARELTDPASRQRLVLEGLPVACAQYARAHSALPKRLFDRVVPRTTLISAGKRKSKRLSKSLSERVLRVVKIIALADEVFGNHDRAIYWLTPLYPSRDYARSAP